MIPRALLTAVALSLCVLPVVAPGAQEEPGRDGVWEENSCAEDLCHLEIPPLEEPVTVIRHQVVMARDYTHFVAALRSGELDLKGKQVLDVATGVGGMALLAAHFGAARVVGTDLHPVAVVNAEYNAARAGWSDVMSVRMVTPDAAGAYAPVAEGERFDVVLCNPPWEDAPAGHFEEHLDVDPGHQLIRSLLEGLETHLNPAGMLVLLYGPPGGSRMVHEQVEARGWTAEITWEGRTLSLASFLSTGVEFDPQVGVSPMVVITP